MTAHDDVVGRVQAVARSTFGDPDLVVTAATTSDHVPGWDSLAHVSFIAAVEREFGLRFSIPEVAMLDSIGDLVTLIASKHGGGV